MGSILCLVVQSSGGPPPVDKSSGCVAVSLGDLDSFVTPKLICGSLNPQFLQNVAVFADRVLVFKEEIKE